MVNQNWWKITLQIRTPTPFNAYTPHMHPKNLYTVGVSHMVMKVLGVHKKKGFIVSRWLMKSVVASEATVDAPAYQITMA
jgi:hypothetical protein